MTTFDELRREIEDRRARGDDDFAAGVLFAVNRINRGASASDEGSLDVDLLARAMLTTEPDGYKPEDWWQVSGAALYLFEEWASRAAAEYVRLSSIPPASEPETP